MPARKWYTTAPILGGGKRTTTLEEQRLRGEIPGPGPDVEPPDTGPGSMAAQERAYQMRYAPVPSWAAPRRPVYGGTPVGREVGEFGQALWEAPLGQTLRNVPRAIRGEPLQPIEAPPERPSPWAQAAGFISPPPMTTEEAQNPLLAATFNPWIGAPARSLISAIKPSLAYGKTATRAYAAPTLGKLVTEEAGGVGRRTAKKLPEVTRLKIDPGEVFAHETSSIGSKFEYRISLTSVEGAPQLKYRVEMRMPGGSWESANTGASITPEGALDNFVNRVSRLENIEPAHPAAIAARKEVLDARAAEEAIRQVQKKAEETAYKEQQIRREEIDNAFGKASFKQQSTRIKGSEGTNLPEAKGPSIGGLVVHSTGEGKGKRWGVTHQVSGLAVGPGYKSQNEAKIFAFRLSQLTDWTQSAEVIKKQMKRIGPATERMRQNVYADLSDVLSEKLPKPAPAAQGGQVTAPYTVSGEDWFKQAWDSSKLGVRAQLVLDAKWVTNKGQMSQLGEKIAQSKWDELSPATKNVMRDYLNRRYGRTSPVESIPGPTGAARPPAPVSIQPAAQAKPVVAPATWHPEYIALLRQFTGKSKADFVIKRELNALGQQAWAIYAKDNLAEPIFRSTISKGAAEAYLDEFVGRVRLMESQPVPAAPGPSPAAPPSGVPIETKEEAQQRIRTSMQRYRSGGVARDILAKKVEGHLTDQELRLRMQETQNRQIDARHEELRKYAEAPAEGVPPSAGGELPTKAKPLEPERGFVTHTGESPMGSPLLRKLYDEDPITYSPITNKATLDAAWERVNTDPIAARAKVMSAEPLSPETMVDTLADGFVLMRKAATEGNVTELRDLSRRIAERYTPTAQALQLASTIDKLTPEGIFVYTQRIIKKAVEKGQGPAVAKRIQAQAQKEAVKQATKETTEEVVKAQEKVVRAKKAVADATDAAAPVQKLGQPPTTKGNQRARDLQYLIDDSVREVQAKLTPAERQAIIKAKAILKQSVAEMDKATAESFLDRAADLNKLQGEARVKAIMELVEEVRQLPQVKAGVAAGKALKPSPKLLKQQAADLTQLIDRTARNVYQQLNSVDRLVIARVKNLLKRTDVELPQGMAEELLVEARKLRGLPQKDQASALNKLTEKIKSYDPVARELARKRAVADAEARLRQAARQAAQDLEALIDAHARKTTKGITPASRLAIGQAKAVLRKYGAELPRDMAEDFLAKARAIDSLPEAERATAIRNLVNEIKEFNPVKQAREEAQVLRERARAAVQEAKDILYLAHQELRVSKVRVANVEREAVRSAKARLKTAGVDMPEELAQSFLDRASALRGIADEYDQMRAAQALMRDVNALIPPSKTDQFLSIIGLNRIFQASMDLSFIGRQGWPYVFSHPKEWWRAAKVDVRSFASEDVAAAVDRQFFSRPLFKPLQEAGLEYVDRFGPLSRQQEEFMGVWAERIPGIKQSNRAFVTTSNKLRADVIDAEIMGMLPPEIRQQVLDGTRKFNTLDELVEATGRTREDFEKLAKFHNALTGRGNTGRFLETNNKWLGTIFYAPRFAWSRIEIPGRVLDGIARNPNLRRTIMRDFGAFVGGTTTTLVLLDQVPGISVEWDPRSSDFRKIRWGNMRVSIDAGFDVLVRYMAQALSGQRKTTGTGRIEDVNRLEVLLGGYLASKLSPTAGEVVDQTRGYDAMGNPVLSWDQRLKAVASDFIPFMPQDIYESWKAEGIAGAAVAAPLGATGFSITAYEGITDAQNRVAATLFSGTPYEALSPLEKDKVNKSPEVSAKVDEAEGKRRIEPRDLIAVSFQNYEAANEEIEAELSSAVKAGASGKVLKDFIQKAKERRWQNSQTTFNRDVEAALKRGKDQKLKDILREQYWAADAPQDMLTGEIDFKARDKTRADVLRRAKEAGIEERFITEKVSPWKDPAVAKVVADLEAAQETLRPYWELKEGVLEYYAPKYPQLKEAIKGMREMEAAGQPEVADRLAKRDDVKFYLKEVTRARQNYRRINKKADEAGRKWYGWKPLKEKK